MAGRYSFGDFTLDPRERRLSRGDEVIRLEPKSFDLLNYLLSHAGRLVEKQEIVDAVWQQSIVTDNSLTRCIHQVRTALGDDADSPEFIETVPGSGYRFIAPVSSVAEPEVADGTFPPERRRVSLLPAALLAIVAFLGVVWLGNLTPDRTVAPIERIAVLPLTNLTGDPGQQYFVQGIHDALIAELSQIESIDVISRTSVMQYRDTTLTISDIAGQLDVDAIVEGSVSRAGDMLTVTTQLIAAAPERHLWADRFHRSVGEVFEIASEVVRSIAAEIEIELSPAEVTRLNAARLVNAEAYDAYLLGLFNFELRTADGFNEAQKQFRRAMEIDPDFAPAYIGLAHTFGSAAIFGMLKPADSMPAARSLAEQAMEIDDSFVDAHMIQAGVSFYWDWNWAVAEKVVGRVLDSNASSAHAYSFLSEVLSVTGRHEDALAAIERGRDLDPMSPISQFKPSLILYLMRDYDRAIDNARAGLQFYPDFWQGHWLLCLPLAATGRHDEAIEACEAAVTHSRRTPMALGALGYVYAQSGKRDEAEQIIAELESLSSKRYVGPSFIAMIHGALGNMDSAFEALQRGFAERDIMLIHAENYGVFDPLRADSRYHALRKKALASESQ